MKNELLKLIKMASKGLFYGILAQCFLYSMLWAAEGKAQSESLDKTFVRIEHKELTIKQLLLEVEKNTDFNFVYLKELLNEDFSLVLDHTGKLALSDLLMQVSKKTQLKFKQVNNTIYLGLKNKKIDEMISRNEPAQTRRVTGTVTSQEDGQGLPGVNVIERGTTNGTVTNVEGAYTLDVSEGAVLVFSSVGYTREEITVGNRSMVDLVMAPDVQQLEELIVVGYGTMQKRHLTGSVGSIQMDETLESRPMIDFGHAMYGKIAGVQVLDPSGRPGESTRIQIRGVNSISAGSSPLIVVDGVILPDYDLNAINSADIESIDILKDASSAAIYGSRGANGVILVTTKSGKPGKPTMTFNYSSSLQRVMKKVDVMNGPEYAQAAIDAAQNGWIDSGGDPNAPNTIEARGQYKYMWPEALENPETLPNVDWQDVVYRVAPMHKADLGFSGGDERTRYYISAGMVNQMGIVIKSEYEKYTLNMKADAKANNWLTVGGMLNVAFDKESEPDSYTLTGATQYPSIFPIWTEDGMLGGTETVEGFENHYGILFRAYHGHPDQGLREQDLTQRLNTAGNLFAEITLLKDLKFRNAINAFYRRNDHSYYSPVERDLGINYRATYDTQMGRTLYYTTENLLMFNRNFGDHHFSAVAGFESNTRDFYSVSAERRDYDNDLTPYLAAGKTVYAASDDASKYKLISVLGRISYNYRDKYMASASFRRDGSSRFGPAKKWGNFPALSVGWRVSEEPFMDDQDFMSNLNFRASYGLTGNDNFGNYRWVSAMAQGRAALGTNLITTYYPSRIENPDLAWERTRVYNFGIDMGILNNRFSLEADIYKSESDGLLLDVPVPSTSGFTNVFRNIGALQTNGVELNLTSHNLTGPLTWNSQVTFAASSSKITRLGPDDAPMVITRTNMSIINEIGKKPFSFYAYQYDGVYMSQAEIEADPVEYPFPVHPGHGRYVDVSGDGRISSADRTIVGNAQPDFTWAFTNNFRFSNFDFSFMFHGSVGNDVYDAVTRRSMFYHEGRNYLGKLRNRWRSEAEPGDGYHYKLSVDIDGLEKEPSSYWITDGSYIRLKDVTLGYTFPGAVLQKLGLGGLRLYFNGTNLLTFQNTTAVDPENSTSSTDPSTIGVQFSPYPTAKVYSLGINVNF